MTHERSLGERLLYGAVAGVAATFVLQLAETLLKKAIPETEAPIKDDPGALFTRKIKRMLPGTLWMTIDDTVETIAGAGMGLGYGASWGAMYGALQTDPCQPALEGAALGLACWAAGYLGWLPATGLLPCVTEQTAPQIAGPIITHAIYGVATAEFYNLLLNVDLF